MEKTIDSGIMNSLVGERATEQELINTPLPPSNEEGRNAHRKLDISMDKPSEDPFQDETDEEAQKKGRGADKVKRKAKGEAEVTRTNEPVKKKAEDNRTAEEKAKSPINYGALAAERTRRREIEAREAQKDKEIADLKAMIAKQSQPQQQAPQFEQDPLGALYQNQQEINQRFTNAEQQAQQTQQQQRAAQEFAQLDNVFTTAVQNFKQTQPDIEDAFQYAWQSREQELTMQGIPQQQAKNMVTHEYVNALIYALDNGIDPAQYAYDLAQTRGYRPVQQSPITQKFNNIKQGMNVNRTLSNGSHGNNSDTGLEKFANIGFGSLLNDAQTKGGGKITRAFSKYNRNFTS